MNSSRRIAYIRFGARAALLLAALILGVIAYTGSNLPALGGALVAAALGLRPMDLAALRSLQRDENPATLASEKTGASIAEGPLQGDDDKPMNAEDTKVFLVRTTRERPLLAFGFPAIVLAMLSAATEQSQALVVLSTLCFLLSIGFLLWGAGRQDRVVKIAISRVDIIAFTLITAGTLVIRLVDLNNTPASFHVDEGIQGVFSLTLLTKQAWHFASTRNDFALPYLFPYAQAAGVAIFGADALGLRLASAVFGTACVALTYGAARAGFGSTSAALFAAFLVAVNNLHLQFSRLGMPAIGSAPWAILALWALLRSDAAAESGRRPLLGFAIAGIAAGLAQYFYAAGRLVPILLAIWTLHMILRKRVSFAQIMVMLAGGLISIAPLLVEYAIRPELVIGRASAVDVFSNPDLLRHTLGADAQMPRDFLKLLVLQSTRVVEFFVFRGDSSGFYTNEIAPLDATTAALFWIGFGISILRIKKLRDFAAVSWVVVTAIAGGIPFLDPPSGPRMIIVMPAIALICATSIEQLWRLLTSITGFSLRWLALPILLGATLTAGYTQLDAYFGRYASQKLYGSSMEIVRTLAYQQDRYRAYVMGDPNIVGFTGTRYMASRAFVRAIEQADALPAPDMDEKGTVVIATAGKAAELDRYKARYPGGASSSYVTPQGQLMFLTYRIPPK